jgi:predicted DNA-binding transcriptional regulator AlpA
MTHATNLKPPAPFCDLHKMSLHKCGCMPTDDGPGQPAAEPELDNEETRTTMTINTEVTLPATGYIRQKDLVGKGKIIPFSATTLWRKVAQGLFPKPVRLSAGVTAWRVEDVRHWMAEKNGPGTSARA